MPVPLRSKIGIPEDAISLSEAYEEFYQQRTSAWKKLDTDYGKGLDKHQRALSGATKEEWESSYREWQDAGRMIDQARKGAEIEMRTALASREIIALVRHPTTGERLRLLNPDEWGKRTNFAVPGFSEDFVFPEDLIQPGPDGALIGGEYQPIFFVRDDFDKWLTKSNPPATTKRGRKPKYDWPDVNDFVFQTMDSRGEFRDWDVGDWKSQADLEREVAGYMSRHGGEPAASTVRLFVKRALARWRNKNAGN